MKVSLNLVDMLVSPATTDQIDLDNVSPYNIACKWQFMRIVNFITDFKSLCDNKEFFDDIYSGKMEKDNNFVSEYRYLIKRLEEKEILKEILLLINKPGEYGLLTSLINYLLDIYERNDFKSLDKSRENIKRLKYLAIKDIDFNPEFVKIQSKRVIEKGDKNSDSYLINSFYTDGRQEWRKALKLEVHYNERHRLEYIDEADKAYNVEIENYKYILHYTKTKNHELTQLYFICNNLAFDGETLPLFYDELYSDRVWQGLPIVGEIELSEKQKYISDLKQFCILLNGSDEIIYGIENNKQKKKINE